MAGQPSLVQRLSKMGRSALGLQILSERGTGPALLLAVRNRREEGGCGDLSRPLESRRGSQALVVGREPHRRGERQVPGLLWWIGVTVGAKIDGQWHREKGL